MRKLKRVQDDSRRERTRQRHSLLFRAQTWIEQQRGERAFPPGPGDWIYFIKEWGGPGKIKVGYSSDVRKRLAALQTGTSADLFVAGWIAGTKVTEAKIHSAFSDYRVRGEWFNPGPKLLDFIIAVHGRETQDDEAVMNLAAEHLSMASVPGGGR